MKWVRVSRRIRIIARRDQIVFVRASGDYRIIYAFNLEKNEIHLLAIGHRREIYQL